MKYHGGVTLLSGRVKDYNLWCMVISNAWKYCIHGNGYFYVYEIVPELLNIGMSQ